MAKATLSHVKNRCQEGRFFQYDGWHDRVFAPPAIIIIWLFIRLGLSASFASWLSGLVVIVGAWGLSQENPYCVLVGSFGYISFYLLDYVDGGVARFNKKSGIGGQYLDWIIHVIASVSTMSGLTIGAIRVTGVWIALFGILAIVGSSLTLARFSMAWFAICMERQQRIVNGCCLEIEIVKDLKNSGRIYFLVKRLTLVLFHENYLIFSLPILSFLNLFVYKTFDYRPCFVLIAGVIYPLVMFWEVHRLASRYRLDRAYSNLFNGEQPNLPRDHFFEDK